jgi:hypothetical protein
MSNYSSPPVGAAPSMPKPGKIQAIAMMTIVNGALNIVWGAGLAFALLIGLVTIVCIPIAVPPMILGVFELLYGIKLLSNPPQPMQPSQTLAILEICCIVFGNVFSMIVGILALVLYNELDVRTYFAELNGYVSAS